MIFDIFVYHYCNHNDENMDIHTNMMDSVAGIYSFVHINVVCEFSL